MKSNERTGSDAVNTHLQHYKALIKAELLKRLHAREEISLRIANRVLSEGLRRRLAWNYEDHTAGLMSYMAACHRGGFSYAFTTTLRAPVLYGSAYAFMLNSMLDTFEDDAQIQAWIDYFDRFQSDDGLFRDEALIGDAFEHRGDWGEGWGTRHLTAHMIIPYARAGRIPPRPFRFLEPLYDVKSLDNWLNRFHFRDRLWSQSNYIMNLYTQFQFARDHMNEPRAELALQQIGDWLRDRQNSQTGLWHETPLETRAQANDAIRAAYHYYPLFEYERTPLPFDEKLVDTVLPTQNSWGGFEEESRPSGACEDIDALDPLLRFARRTNHRADEVRLAAEKAFVWLLACVYEDGGSASIPEHGCHYGGHPLTTSAPGQANMFATWFRTLTLAYVTQYLDVPQKFKLGHYPGYEIALPRPQV